MNVDAALQAWGEKVLHAAQMSPGLKLKGFEASAEGDTVLVTADASSGETIYCVFELEPGEVWSGFLRDAVEAAFGISAGIALACANPGAPSITSLSSLKAKPHARPVH